MEQDRFLEQYAQMTPEERNAELRQIFRFKPKEGLRETLEYRGQWERRERAETLTVLKKRLDSLLNFAEITPSFRRYILEDFEISYASGSVPELGEAAVPEEELVLLDESYPNTAGIFNKERAKEIERWWYKNTVKLALGSETLRGKLLQEFYPELSAEYGSFQLRNRDNLLQLWRQEFIERYGEEP